MPTNVLTLIDGVERDHDNIGVLAIELEVASLAQIAEAAR